jgi:group I intron endonuclease
MTNTENVTYKEINNPYGFIYITTNLINGKRYLGQKKFYRNWKTYLGSGQAFKKAVKKYGEENFSKNIIYICYSADELDQIEYDLSVFFNVVESDDWYNLKYGGRTMHGYSPSLETRAKISKANKGKPAPNKGIPMSEETKRKQSEAQSGDKSSWYGRHHTEESKIKIRESRIGTTATEETKVKMKKAQMGDKNHFYGKHHSEESKKKMSEAKQGTKSPKARQIVQLTKNLEFIKEWAYIQQASDALGILATNISACCRNGTHRTAGGFCWMYLEDYCNTQIS